MIGTFSLTGAGSSLDPLRPNWESAPGGPLGYVPVKWSLISSTTTSMTVSYQVQP